ncbi:MAG: MoaD/ThiS family protein [Bacillota bacterium]
MKATVRYYGYLQILAGVTEEVIDEPDAGRPNSLADLIEAVVRRRPNLRDVCVVGPELDRNLLVFRNHERVPGRSLNQAALADGDAVDLVPPLGGGGAA